MNGEQSSLKAFCVQWAEEQEKLHAGGTAEGQARQSRLGRMNVRQRLAALIDPHTTPFELGLWAGWKMYEKWGELPAAGVVTTIAQVAQKRCMIIANDATVKAGAMFPQSIKKVLRAQKIAQTCRLPIIYLVDSSGVFLPLQDEIFPDEDDFGRIFRNNAIFSAEGLPQFAAIMGNCIAGGGYLPVLCDVLLMTKGSGLYLAGPALVKAAIGQIVDSEELGGAQMHAAISGTVDFLEEDDESCLKRLRKLVELLPVQDMSPKGFNPSLQAAASNELVYSIVDREGRRSYQMRDLLYTVVDADSWQEYKEQYGPTLLTAWATIAGIPVGIVASQRALTQSGRGEQQIGGVIYPESADKAARFVLDCNQMRVPLLFFQDVMGFMVGAKAEQAGIIRSGAKLVNAISNSKVPKITVIVGNSFGAGHYALCGKAYDPTFIVAWPNARYAVMGAEQAADTLMEVKKRRRTTEAGLGQGREAAAEIEQQLQAERLHLKELYSEQMDIRYGAARGWVDALIAPDSTRQVLIELLLCALQAPLASEPLRTGVLQV